MDVTWRELEERIKLLAQQVDSCCDLIKTWAREHGTEQCVDPYRDLGMRDLVDQIWCKLSSVGKSTPYEPLQWR